MRVVMLCAIQPEAWRKPVADLPVAATNSVRPFARAAAAVFRNISSSETASISDERMPVECGHFSLFRQALPVIGSATMNAL